MFEIDTQAGTVFSASETLARAMAEILDGDRRRTEDDLLEAVRMPLDDEFRPASQYLVA